MQDHCACSDQRALRKMPYVHVVVLKVKPGTTADKKEAIVAGVHALKAQIPEIAMVRAGLDLGLDPSGCQLALVATFASAEAYQVYAKHPAHVALITERIKPVLEQRAAVQFSAAADPGAAGVTHCVLLKMKDDATAAQKEAIIAALSALPGDIPQIKAYRVGADAGTDPAKYDIAIVGDFSSKEDYGDYAKHAKHVNVITSLIKPILAERVAVQFAPVDEVDGPPLGQPSARPDIVPAGATTIELDCGRGTTLRGRTWGPVDGEPWLVLHGWLDNCASFDYLVPELLKSNNKNRFVCLDVAGHGHSAHRMRGSYSKHTQATFIPHHNSAFNFQCWLLMMLSDAV